jgi:hypothetical protein
VSKIKVCVWEKALLWGESEYPSLGTLSMGVAVHAYLNLGIKDWPLNLGGFGLHISLSMLLGMCLGVGWSMSLGISGCSMRENSKGMIHLSSNIYNIVVISWFLRSSSRTVVHLLLELYLDQG